MMKAAFLVGVVTCAWLAGSAQADDLTTLCSEVGHVEVGQWASYRTKAGGKGGETDMRLAIVGAKKLGESSAYWLEMKMGGKQGEMITQVLVAGYPYETDDIQEMVMKAGDQPAMSMPKQAMAMMRGRVDNAPNLGGADRCGQAKVVGWESLSVPAGTFRALHIEPTDSKSHVWASNEVPFGMIKVEGKDLEMVLIGHGKDAKSSITETPMSMPGMGGR